MRGEHADVEPGQYVLIAITDTGAGMSPEVAARAFDPFFTTKADRRGHRAGLSQVYGFVKQSRGHIKIYSEVGAGTTVKIYLPRHHRRRQPPRPGTGAARVEAGSAEQVILLVEDDAADAADGDRGAARAWLYRAGLRRRGACADDARHRPDVTLLFTDVVMPEINGKRLAEEALRRRPGLKVLYTTGYTPNAVVHGGVLDAGVELLTKPFTLEQLATKVKAVLNRR